MSDLFYNPRLGDASAPVKLDLSSVDWQNGLLVRSTNWLGDVVMSLPAVYRLKSIVPESLGLFIVCPQKLASLWKSVSWVTEVIPFSGKRIDQSCRELLIQRSPGVSVILPNSFGSAWDLWKANLANRIGRRGRGRTVLLDHGLPAWNRKSGKENYHESRKYLEISQACGSEDWGCDYPALKPTIDIDSTQKLNRFIDERPLLVIAPGAAYGPAKQWSAESFNLVVKWWTEEVGSAVVEGVKNEIPIGQSVISNCANATNLAGKTNLQDLMYLISKSTCVLCNDSGVMHLAAGLHKNGVAVFGSTDPIATGPIGGRWIIMKEYLPCSPCFKRTCHLQQNLYKCLTQISAESVIDKIKTHMLG